MTEPGQTQGQNSEPRRRHRWAWLWWALIIVGMGLGGFGWVLYNHADRPIKAPVWLHERIEARLGDALPGADIRFGDISLLVPRTGRPRILLRDAEIVSEDGRPILSLADLEARVAFRPLLRGQVLLGRLRLSGASVTVRRRADGTFDLSFGALPEARKAASPAELVRSVDALLQTPELAALTRVEVDALTLQYEDARADRAWTVDGARFELVREGDQLRGRGDLALLGGQAYATTLAMNFESRIGQVATRFGMNFEDMAARDIASQVGALAWLEALRAPIGGALRTSLDEAGRLGPLSGTLQIGEGVLQPNDRTRPVPFRSARSYFTYDPGTETLSFDELSVDSQWVTGRAEGKAILKGIEAGRPRELQGQFSLTGLKGNPAEIYPQPVSVDGAQMTFRLGLAPFDLTLGEASLTKDGHVIVLDGRLFAEEGGWNFAVNGQVDDIGRDTVLDFWPETAKPKTRDWVAENIHALTLTNTQLAYRARPGEEPQLYLGSEFVDGEIRFLKYMPEVTGAAGRAELMGSRFVVTAARGTVLAPQGGPVDVTGTSLIVEDVRIKGPPAVVRLRAEGTITAGLSLLDQEPLRVMTKAERPVTLADGRVTAAGDIHVRLKKGYPAKDVTYDIAADLRDVRSAKLIPGRVFAASALGVQVTPQDLVIKGRGRVGQVPFDGTWAMPIRDNPGGVSRAEGVAQVNQAFLDEFNISLPRGSVSGSGAARFAIDLAKGKEPGFHVTSKLKGIGLSIPQLGWSLPAQTGGDLEVRGRLGKIPAVDRITLEAPGLSAMGAIRLNAQGLEKASFSQVKAGSWLDAPITLVGRGRGVAPAVELEGGRLDLRGMPKGSGAGGDRGADVPLRVRLDRLQVTDTIALTGLRGNFATQGGLRGDFAASVNGGAAIAGQVVPSGRRSAFSITSADAGAAISDAGLLSKASKGDLTLTLKPVGADSYDGRLKIAGVWLTDAPAVANLLNAASIIGLLEQMSGGGILFNEVDAKFRLNPSQVVLRKGSAVGASIGISMDGIYDIASKSMDMQGVFSPVYAVNAIGSVLTRKGEGLIGFNFTMKGAAENPRVSVNPLSLFTPGMFREIFRRPAPKVD